MSWRLSLHDRKLSRARQDCRDNEVEEEKNGMQRESRLRGRVAAAVLVFSSEKNLKETPPTSDLLLKETAPECSSLPLSI